MKTTYARLVRATLYLFATLALCVMLWGASCPQDAFSKKSVGLYFAVINRGEGTQGEILNLRVSVQPLSNDEINKPTTITVIAPEGITAVAAPSSFTLPSAVEKVGTFDLRVTIGDNVAVGSYNIQVSRTGSGLQEERVATYSLTVLDDLVSVEIPTEGFVRQGSQLIMNVEVKPRGNTHGTVTLFSDLKLDGVTALPSRFNVDLVRNVTTPKIVPITISATSTAPLGRANLEIIQGSTTRASRLISVVRGQTGTPTFEITADPTTVLVKNGETAGNVTFHINSINGFTGPVKVTWVVDGFAEPVPNTNNTTYNISPSTPATFTLAFRRMATDPLPIIMNFNATDVPFTTTKSVAITLNEH